MPSYKTVIYERHLDRLQPCPECQSKGKLKMFTLLSPERFKVGCEKCDMYGPSAKTHTEAREAWNILLRGE